MYSPDRKQYLEKQIHFLKKMTGYDECQKILVVDGLTNVQPDGFDVVEMTRSAGFNWSRAWQTGVDHSKFDNILYLDCDRLFPKNYLLEIQKALQESPDCFVYTPNLFTIRKYPGEQTIDEILASHPEDIKKNNFDGCIMYEPRFTHPVHFPGKNAMSGSVAFAKDTFLRSGGVDSWYEGHGAFADSDFFMQTVRKGLRFYVLPDLVELHFGHTKRDESNNIISDGELKMQGLYNFIYYCKKWGIGFEKAIIVAKNIGVPNPQLHLEEVLHEMANNET